MNFCTTLSYPCLNTFGLLKALDEKYSEILQVVTVSVDEDNDHLQNLIRTREYGWKFLQSGSQGNILEEYDIKAFPTYFLISPEGRLLLSPAPGPDKEFEKIFLDIIK